MSESKEPIRLRQRKMPTGNISLYLDIYLNGKRTYEYLKMYLIPEQTRADREKNKETLKLADAVRAKRVIELRNGQFGFKTKTTGKLRFFDYYRELCEKRLGEESRGNWGNWYSCLHHLKKYEKRESITLEEITPEWVQGFKDYLENDAVAWGHDYRKRIKDKPLARNSKLSYFNKLRACLNQAYEEGIISSNPLRGIEGFKPEEGTRMYLTLDEVRKLAATECEYPQIKAAFLFSCLTGLRRSDVLRLRPGATSTNRASLPESFSDRRKRADRSISTYLHRRRNLWGNGVSPTNTSLPTFIPRPVRITPSNYGWRERESIRRLRFIAADTRSPRLCSTSGRTSTRYRNSSGIETSRRRRSTQRLWIKTNRRQSPQYRRFYRLI